MIQDYASDHKPSDEADFIPVLILEVELGQILPKIDPVSSSTGQIYCRVRLLVRIHTHPLGIIELAIPTEGISAAQLGSSIWAHLGDSINAHLRLDGLAELSELTLDGVSPLGDTACLHERNALLKEAPMASIIICTRDRSEDLARSLQALVSLRYPRYELIIVDNAPRTTATAKLVAQYSYLPYVRYVREDVPGLAVARNAGLRVAVGDIVAFTDDDAIVDKYWLAELVLGFQAAPNVACVTGISLAAELETQAQEWFEQFGGFNRHSLFSRQIFAWADIARERQENPLFPYTAHRFGAGVNMAFIATALRAIGGFDIALGAGTLTGGAEDIDVFFRIYAKNYTIVNTPGALLYHVHRRDYAGLAKQIHNYGIAFSAFLTRCLLDRPSRILNLLRLLPYAVYYMLNPRSPKHVKKYGTFPSALVRAEAQGLLYGPIAYFRSRRRVLTLLRH